MKSKSEKIIGNLALIALLFLVSNKVLAQWHPLLGIKAGLNVDNVASKPVFGTNIGLYAALEYKHKWGLNVEAFYAERNWLGTNSGIKLNYVEIPVYANYFLPGDYGSIRPKFVFGPCVSFLLTDAKSIPLPYLPADMEISAIIGIGFNKDLSKAGGVVMFFDARYMQGFTNIAADGSAGLNKTLRFHAGVGFSLTGGRPYRLKKHGY